MDPEMSRVRKLTSKHCHFACRDRVPLLEPRSRSSQNQTELPQVRG